MDKMEFAKLMAVVNNLFETKAKNKEGMSIWFKVLQDLDYGLAEKAVYSLGRTKSGFLSPADIRKACEEITSPKINIVEAYQLMTDTIRVYGRYQHQKAMEHLEAKNPNMHKVVKAIGYQQLCNCNLEFTRGPIERMYKAVVMDKEKANLLGNYQKEINEVTQIALKGMGE